MAFTAEGYFEHLKAYINMKHYGITPSDGVLTLKEKVFGANNLETTMAVRLEGCERSFAVKLDQKNKKGGSDPLFHFLDDTSKPWSKRCDFVVFHLDNKVLRARCFEFKSQSLTADSIVAQLAAGQAWCQSLVGAIKHYARVNGRLSVTKFVLSNHPNPGPYLSEEGKYLKADHSIRHYNYKEIDKLPITQLENVCSQQIG